MSLGKKDIAKNISSKTRFNIQYSSLFLNKFLSLLKSNKKTKISSFGVFAYIETKSRMGRNPLTKEEFKIPKLKKLTFKASNNTKTILN
jgi:integration host factor subunit alpha